ncbi:MAG: 3-hydroxyacyl-ACP dehydratase FabZ [Deltaproteobacteria bacterium]|nr:3-hydroxyacyl-ACP dehydratase FabZ [Deltaproteobacteria bacterium]
MTENPLDALPHGYPFRFIDRVLSIGGGKGAAIKNVTANEAFLQGHFKGNPIMPGAVIIEALAQLAGLVMNEGGEAQGAYLAQVRDMRFRRPVTPGDRVELFAELDGGFPQMSIFRVSASVDGVAVAEGEVVMAAMK